VVYLKSIPSDLKADLGQSLLINFDPKSENGRKRSLIQK
jgi:uncharacterized protein Veg